MTEKQEMATLVRRADDALMQFPDLSNFEGIERLHRIAEIAISNLLDAVKSLPD